MNGEDLLGCSQFIESTSVTDANLGSTRYSQATGERSGQAGWLDPSQNGGASFQFEEAEFTSSSDGVRALSVTRKGTWRFRSDEKPFRAE